MLPASGATKPSGACKVKGQSRIFESERYVCTKSGNKLKWVKRLSNSAQAQNQSQKPSSQVLPIFPIVPSENLELDEVSKTINQIRTTVLSQNFQFSGTLTFKFQGATSFDVEVKTKRSIENAIPVFGKFGFEVTDGTFLIARDMSWLRNELALLNCKYGSLPERPGFYVPNTCESGNGVVTSVHWEAEKFGDGLDGLYFNHVLPHEYFHQIQQKMTPFGNADFPKWFWEGSAQFFTNQAWSTWNTKRSYTSWYEHWWTDLRPDLGPKVCKNVSIEMMANPSTPGIEGVCAYSKGQLVVEYLVYKYGLEKYRALYKENNVAYWPNFNIVFKKVTGDELNDFYVEAQKFLESRGWA